MILLLISVQSGGLLLQAQQDPLPATRSIHVGHGIINERANEQRYIPVIFAVEESRTINRGGWLQLFFTAKFNPSYIVGKEGRTLAPEGGMQLGLRAGWPVGNGQYLFGDISTGPHIISEGLGIQKTGFTFSDNISFGWMQTLNDRMMLSLQGRFRHLSNAGIYEPNIGIDNWMLIGGIHWRR